MAHYAGTIDDNHFDREIIWNSSIAKDEEKDDLLLRKKRNSIKKDHKFTTIQNENHVMAFKQSLLFHFSFH
jgi:hypothetical protein